jgi:hypothetical protein
MKLKLRNKKKIKDNQDNQVQMVRQQQPLQ